MMELTGRSRDAGGPLIPADGPRTIAATLTVGAVSAAWGAGMIGPLAAIAGWALAAALILPCLRRAARAERLAFSFRRPGEPTSQSLLSALQGIGRTLADMAHRLDQVHPVTELPTREELFAAIAAATAKERGGLLGMIRFADYDRLAAFDQESANRLLARFAKRVAGAVAAGHLVAQVDRDCVAVWFGVGGDAARAEFRSILYVAGQEMEAAGASLTPVVEAAMVGHEEQETPLRLLTRARASLIRAEAIDGHEADLPSPPSASEARDRFWLEQDLAHALTEDQLAMVFQPVVDLAKGRLVGAEALLRWQHPERGAVSPARFIPVVEEAGLSARYGLWVLNAACREARLWQDHGLAGLRVAVNLSARQLGDEGLPLKIERTLARHGLEPSALELELTETATMADAARTHRLFSELAEMGISLAIDDFGSGYSSLSYLKNLPFNKLKIDREFVTHVHRRRDSRAICEALVTLGRGLDLVVLAEGVEEEAEVAALRELGCEVFQGYFFSRPLSGDDFRARALGAGWGGPLDQLAGHMPEARLRMPA